MNALKIVFATLVIFIAGIVTGVVLVRFAERSPKAWMRVQREMPNNPKPVANVPGNLNLPNNPNRPSGQQPTNPGTQNAGPMSREFAQVLERQLRLTPEQREQVSKIMSEGQERIRELRQGIDPEIRKEMQKTHEQIQSLLTVEQREQFQRLMRQRLQRRNETPDQPDRRFRDPREQRGQQEFREPRGPLPPMDGDRSREPRNPQPPIEPQPQNP